MLVEHNNTKVILHGALRNRHGVYARINLLASSSRLVVGVSFECLQTCHRISDCPACSVLLDAPQRCC